MEANKSYTSSRFPDPLSRMLLAIKNTKKDTVIEQFLNEAANVNRKSDVRLGEKCILTDNLEEVSDWSNIVNIATLINSVDTVLSGKTFLGRIIVEPYILEAVVFLAEDPEGERVVRIEVFEDSSSRSSRFCKGVIVALRNPCLKSIRRDIDGLQYQSVVDVMVFEENQFKLSYPNIVWQSSICSNSPLGKSSRLAAIEMSQLEAERISHIREGGNNFFKEGKYSEAVEKYTEGISVSPRNEDLLSNRSLCYLKIFKYAAALKDALLILQSNPLHVKAVYRGALAYNGLKKFENAKDLLQSKINMIQSGQLNDLRSLLTKTKNWLRQRNDGQYDMVELFKSLKKRVYHDIADYWGPVKVENIPVKGRGLIATENVKAGQLLLCLKAVDIHFSSSNGEPYEQTEIYLARKIEERMKNDRELFEQFVELNTFSKTRNTNPIENKESMSKRQKYKIINSVVSEFSVSFTLSDGGHFCGLWFPACYLNNDCFDTNCAVYFYGDVSQIRANKNFLKGEELLIPYQEQGIGYFARKASFNHKGPQCHCGLCTYESREDQSTLMKREGLIFQLQIFFRPNLTQLESIVKELKILCSQSPYSYYYLSSALFKLSYVLYYNANNDERAIEVITEFMDNSLNSGGHIAKVLHQTSYMLFKLYLNKRDVPNATKWKRRVLAHLQLTFGCSSNEFQKTVFPSILDDINSLDILTEASHRS